MSRSEPRRSSLSPENRGLWADLIRQLRLIWRLYFDPRVSLWLKAIPTTALIYLISPIDPVPELVLPVVGLVDDLGAITLALTAFVNLCPPDIVAEHMQAILGGTTWRVVPPDPSDASPATPKVIDAPYTVKSDDDDVSSQGRGTV